MRAFWSHTREVLRREWSRWLRQPIYFVLLLAVPALSFAFFAALFDKGIARDIPIAVLDEDHTDLSRTLRQMIDAAPTPLVAYEIQDMDEGGRMMREGRIAAIVQIPSDFEKSILSNRQTHVENYVSGANISVNGLLSKDIQTAVSTFSAGIQIQLLTKQGLTERQAMAQLMPVRFDRHVLFNPYINYGYYLLPSFLPMILLLITVLTTILAIGSELKYATAPEWLGAAHGSLGAALAGKLLPVTGLLLLVAGAMLVLLFGVAGVPLNGSAALLAVGTVLFVAAYQAVAILIVAVAANLRLALSLGGGYSVLAFTFSGLTFPIMAMWEPMQWGSRIFPFTYYTDLIVDQALRGAPAARSLPDLCALALFVILPLLCLRRLRRVCTEEKFWGRM